MTTVLFKDGVLAADSQQTNTLSGKITNVNKLKRFNNSIVGCCGSVEVVLVFEEFMKTGKISKTKLKHNGFHALQWDGEQLFGWSAEIKNRFFGGYKLISFQKIELSFQFAAIGSGADFAIGALAVGASMKEAIEAAAEFDSYTNTNMKVMKL